MPEFDTKRLPVARDAIAPDGSDVRVLQVVYSFPRARLPVYLGQQMDAYIQAPSDVAARRGPH